MESTSRKKKKKIRHLIIWLLGIVNGLRVWTVWIKRLILHELSYIVYLSYIN
uniref:Uncharacterized protein n=1 Tax=Salix viminalis TaxID=40686 RepID=A0A6N2KNW8_SALVM